ncbi:MAG: hypothetical protein LBB37_03400 [Endomicrobium sp.]|jgi:hypothetical protein|nr:hypothetical protein [Endomicrobium sp.]
MKKIISLSVALMLFFTSFEVNNAYSIKEKENLQVEELKVCYCNDNNAQVYRYVFRPLPDKQLLQFCNIEERGWGFKQFLKKKEEEALREYDDFSPINGSRPCLLRRTNREIMSFFSQEMLRCEEVVRIDRAQRIASLRAMQEVRQQRNAEVNKRLARIFEPIFRPIKAVMSVIFTGFAIIAACLITLGALIGLSECIGLF